MSPPRLAGLNPLTSHRGRPGGQPFCFRRGSATESQPKQLYSEQRWSPGAALEDQPSFMLGIQLSCACPPPPRSGAPGYKPVPARKRLCPELALVGLPGVPQDSSCALLLQAPTPGPRATQNLLGPEKWPGPLLLISLQWLQLPRTRPAGAIVLLERKSLVSGCFFWGGRGGFVRPCCFERRP